MYAERVNREYLVASLLRPCITAILGPRRVGKTFFVQHYAKEHSHLLWVFLNMDEMLQRERVKSQELEQMIVEKAKQNIGGTHKIWVVIDEAQKCPELFDQVKILYDRYKDLEKIKFVVTGSAALSLHQLTHISHKHCKKFAQDVCSDGRQISAEKVKRPFQGYLTKQMNKQIGQISPVVCEKCGLSAETLAGRIELHYLQEFTLWEATEYLEPTLPRRSLFAIIQNNEPHQIKELLHELRPFKPQLEKQLQQHLLWGGFPELMNYHSDTEKLVYINNYIQTYLEKDIRTITTIDNLSLYRNAMILAAEQTDSLRDDSSIINALGCTRDTLKKYRGYLAATLLYRDLYPYIRSTMKRVVKSPKGYLMNNGLISALTGLVELKPLVSSGLIGHRFENWFLNELTVWLARDPMRAEIYFWRLPSGVEVDFIVERKPNVYPFEVTYNNKPDQDKVRNITKFLQEEPRASWGYYIYRGDFHIDAETKICFIPAWSVG